MYKFFSRVTSTCIPSRFRNHTGATASHTHSFPVAQADLDLLKEQVRSLVGQKLDHSTLLALARSTAFELRKDVIRLNSIGDINTILDETDAIANLVFTEIGQHIPRFRHALRQEYFQQLIGIGSNFNLDQFKLLQNHTGFPGRNQIQHEIIRRQIESHIEAEYNLAPCRNTQRISRQSISSVPKGQYAQHCLNLYNLNMPIDQKTTDRMIKLRREIRMPREWDQYFRQAHANSTPTHVIIEKLLRANLGSLGNHNTHPASRLLEFSTGFVFHPNSAANIPQLLNSRSPAAFQNVGQLLSEKFLAAYACNNTQYFIESAFIQQDPCFEATVENLIEFKPDQQPNALTVPKAPKWTPLAIASINRAPKQILISKAIVGLAKHVPTGIRNPSQLPYMPIKLEGIGKIVNDSERFPFPQVSKEQAKCIAADIVWAGFYGDALGANLERKLYKEKTETLLLNMKNNKTFENESSNIQRDQLLIQQLKQNNEGGIPHQATDDTQQGLLSAMATMEWMSTKAHADHNALAENVLKSFREPTFPVPNKHGQTYPKGFEIRGSADTLSMCQAPQRANRAWNDVAIEGLNRHGGNTGARAGGAGNGGMMRIGYDLLPLLASGASMQDLIEHALISNQVTHSSSFSAVASVGQVVLMAKCINLRIEAKQTGEPLEVPPNFFVDTFHQVAEALEHPDQKFGLHPELSSIPERHPKLSANQWRSERLPSEFLKASSKSTAVVKAGSVEQALIDSKGIENSSNEIDSVLQRWSSNSYLGATFPSVVFLLEKFGRGNPAHAVNMAALVTKDSDTCATIIAQVIGALYGSEWVKDELDGCKNPQGQPTFSDNLGGGFKVDDFLNHINNFYDQQASDPTH